MRPPVSTAHRSTQPPLCRTVVATVVVSMVLHSLLCLPIADARTLHYHRKHRRHHRHGQHATNNGSHISQPPAALPPDVGVDSPGEPPAFPPDVDHAPPPSSRHDKPYTPSNPPSRTPAFSPVGAPRSPAPAKPPSFSSATPSPSPVKAPSHSHAKPPSIYLAKPPELPPAQRPTLPRAKQPPVSPVRPPSLSPTKAPPSSFPLKPPSTSFSHAKPPSCTLAKPPQAELPRLSPAKPPMHSPAKPPQAELPRVSPAKPPMHSPAKPPQAELPRLSPAKPPTPSQPQPPRLSPPKPATRAPAQSPRLSPAKPPAHAPAPTPPLYPVIPPVAAKPPALPPAMSKAKPPSSLPPAAPTGKNSSAACGNVFDVRAFGALGNGSCDDTRAFRAAWKAACSAGSATLLVPSNGVFTITSTIFAGPCKPGLTFQIDGVLMPPDGPASWPEPDSRRQWIVFYKADGMTLAGRGTMEGNGEEWWNLPCKPHRGPNGSTLPGQCDSPALIRFFVSNNVTVQGLRIENSPQFHLKFDGCERVRVDGLFVSSPAFSPNTDGIHVENTTSVEIYNSRISNGDDCISIGAGCSNVHIENVTCGHGHGISIGSLGVHNTRACVSNITVRNARIIDSDNGVRIKTWQGGAGSVSAVEFAGVRMDNVKNCIIIDQYYCLGSGCANHTSAVRVAGVTYRDIRGTYNPQAGAAPVRFACSDSVACTDITMTDVELLPADDGGAKALLADPYCWNAYGVMETLTLPPVYCLQEGRPDSPAR